MAEFKTESFHEITPCQLNRLLYKANPLILVRYVKERLPSLRHPSSCTHDGIAKFSVL